MFLFHYLLLSLFFLHLVPFSTYTFTNQTIMDEHRHNIFCNFCVFNGNSTCYFCRYNIAKTCTSSMLMMVAFIMEANRAPRKQLIWSHEQANGFMENQLLDNYSRKIFNQKNKVNSICVIL